MEAKGGDGRTPLMVAAAKGRIAVGQLLLDRSADATVNCDKGRTAVVLATQRDHRTIQQVLRAARAK